MNLLRKKNIGEIKKTMKAEPNSENNNCTFNSKSYFYWYKT